MRRVEVQLYWGPAGDLLMSCWGPAGSGLGLFGYHALSVAVVFCFFANFLSLIKWPQLHHLSFCFLVYYLWVSDVGQKSHRGNGGKSYWL